MPQRTWVGGRRKGDKRDIEPLALPVGLCLAPTLGVARQTVHKVMVPHVLRSLVGVAAAHARGADQRQPKRVIVWLVRAVLVIGKNSRAPLAARVRQIDPLVRRHFELLGLRSVPLHGAYAPVIGGHLIRGGQGKDCL